MEAERCLKQLNERFCVIDTNKYEIYFNCTGVNSHVPHRYIYKLDNDMCSLVIFVQRGFWMSRFSHDASEKYYICEATVGGVQYYETWELRGVKIVVDVL